MKVKRGGLKGRENAISFYSRLSKKEKELFRDSINLIFPEKKSLTIQDLVQFEKAKELLSLIQKKYAIALDELFAFAKDLFFPVSILNEKLTILESLVKYLKEEKLLSLHQIAEALGRDERNIWHILENSKKKYPQKFILKEEKILIPLSIFSSTKLSALESIVDYLKTEFSFTYHEIALLLKRDDRTIWTVYQRARKKNESK